MKKIKGSKWLTGALLAVAAIVMVFSGVQGSRAALNYVSNNYVAALDVTKDMGVVIVENGRETGTLLTALPGSYKEFKEGTTYQEQLCVKNNGAIDEYVRVVMRRYWSYADGQKCLALDPELIQLDLGGGWLIDESAGTDELTVLYWPTPLTAGESTANFCSTLNLDGSFSWIVENTGTQVGKYTIIETTSPYNGCYFTLELEVDGVQTHNAADAIQSAWGVAVQVDDDGIMSLR